MLRFLLGPCKNAIEVKGVLSVTTLYLITVSVYKKTFCVRNTMRYSAVEALESSFSLQWGRTSAFCMQLK
jgi:hypothetical protein